MYISQLLCIIRKIEFFIEDISEYPEIMNINSAWLTYLITRNYFFSPVIVLIIKIYLVSVILFFRSVIKFKVNIRQAILNIAHQRGLIESSLLQEINQN